MAGSRISSLEHRLGILHKIAHRYIGWMFEEDELVNQMWLNPKVREAEDTAILARSAYDALFKYFRRNIKRGQHEQLFDCWTDILLNLLKMDCEYLLKDLTRTQKLIVKLRCEKFTYQEIARVVGLTRANLMCHVNRIDKEPFRKWIAA